jgi:hypothetical protein
VIPRVFSVSGPYMTKPELYALGDLILQATHSDTVRIRATRPVYRSYIAAGELIAVCIAAALEGEHELVFDSGGEIAEVGELAALVIAAAGRSGISVERTWDTAAEPDRYVAEQATMARLARRFDVPQQSLSDQVAETAIDLNRSEGERA